MPLSDGGHLVYRNLTCSVAAKKDHNYKQRKIIINGISGVFPKGKLTIVMGASGTGKTTLLQALSGQLSLDSADGTLISGEIYINSRKITDSEELKSISAFVHQDDCIDPLMTVREAVLFSARLRNNKEDTEADIPDLEEHVDSIIDLLELKHLKNSLLGSSSGGSDKRGISGGERKRVAIAMELVCNPSVLFLDEPTTGLDTFMAWRVVQIMHKLTRVAGYTVIMILHQPPSCVFPFFDNLLLLGADRLHGAGIIYQGNASQSLEYFAQLGYQCPRLENPADFYFIKVINNYQSDDVFVKDNRQVDMKRFIDYWKESNNCQQLGEEIESIISQPENQFVILRAKDMGIWAVSRQSRILFIRNWKSFCRSKTAVFIIIFFFPIFEGLLVGLTYLTLGRYSAALQVDLRASALFFITNTQFAVGSERWVFSSVDNRSVFIREYEAKYYGLMAHFVAKLAFSLITGVWTCSVIILISYYMVGFAPAFSSVLFLILTSLLAHLGGCGLGYLLMGVLPRDLSIATLVVRTVTKPMSLVGGLFVISIPAFMVWLKYISPVYYSFSAALQNQLTSLPCREQGDGECAALGTEDIFSLLEYDAVLSPGVCVALGATLAIALMTIGSILYRYRVSH